MENNINNIINIFKNLQFILNKAGYIPSRNIPKYTEIAEHSFLVLKLFI